MKTINIALNLCSFVELSDKAKQRAIEEHRQFELSIMQPNDFISGEVEYDTPENLRSVYNSEYEYLLNNDEPIIENIEVNDYLFFEDGSLANIVTYTGKHPKAGVSEFNFMGNVYDITN